MQDGEQLEVVADNYSQQERSTTIDEEQNLILESDEAQSINHAENEEDYGEVTSNLKRRRTYAYGRCLRVRL